MVLYITCEVKKLFESCVDREIYCTENIGLEKHILRISLSGCGKRLNFAEGNDILKSVCINYHWIFSGLRGRGRERDWRESRKL